MGLGIMEALRRNLDFNLEENGTFERFDIDSYGHTHSHTHNLSYLLVYLVIYMKSGLR